MTLVLLAVVVAALGGFLCRGRPRTFSWPPLRRVGLLGFAAVAVPTSLIAHFPSVAGGWLTAAGLALLWFAVRNRDRPGIGLAIVGVSLNATVIFLNAGMPVSLAAAERASVPASRAELEEDPLREDLTSDTVLPWLGEALPLALPLRPSVASIGDVLLAAGGALFVFTGLTGWGRTVPERPLTPIERQAARRQRKAAKAAGEPVEDSDLDDELDDLDEDAPTRPRRARPARTPTHAAPPPVILVDRDAYGLAGSAVPAPSVADDLVTADEATTDKAATDEATADEVATDEVTTGEAPVEEVTAGEVPADPVERPEAPADAADDVVAAEEQLPEAADAQAEATDDQGEAEEARAEAPHDQGGAATELPDAADESAPADHAEPTGGDQETSSDEEELASYASESSDDGGSADGRPQPSPNGVSHADGEDRGDDALAADGAGAPGWLTAQLSAARGRSRDRARP